MTRISIQIIRMVAAISGAFGLQYLEHSDYVHLNRLVILPLVKSYGVISISTLSPGKTFIMFTRIFPDKWPKTVCPALNWTQKTALGRFSITLPSSSIISFFVLDFLKSCVLVKMALFEN